MPRDDELTATQRAAAIDRVGESLALRSGAGCGKTFVLARRLLELLLASDDPDGAVGRFAALTFTDKAALEMSARVRKMLAGRAAAPETGDDERRRLRAWLDELPEARISTIHGFCASLLRTWAIEAGIDPNFAVCADAMLAERLLSEAAEEAVLRAVEAERDDVAALLASVSFEQATSLVEALLAGRTACDLAAHTDAAAVFERWQSLAAAQCARRLAELAASVELRDKLDRLAAWPCSNPSDRLAVFRDEQLDLIEEILAAGSGASAELFARLVPKPGNIGSAKAWGTDEVREVRAALRDLIARVCEYAIFTERPGQADGDAAGALATLTRLALEAKSLHDAEKRKRGLLDFTDLLTHAAELLSGCDAARRSLDCGIDQLLIDECQDTNEFQLRMLSGLVGAGSPDAPPPDGRLFVVGDAKQSIYRFRGAQVETFQALCERLGQARQEHLDTSFRTHEAGVAFVNHLFEPLMGGDYAAIRAHRASSPPGASVEVLLAADAGGEAFVAAGPAGEAQAALTAERIRELIDSPEEVVWDAEAEAWRPARAGDVAILFARMTNSLDYERELQRRLVPYYVLGGTGFFQQQEVFDVLNALSAVDDAFDDVALFGALRSSLFGLDDNAMMHVAEACEPPYLPALAGAAAAGRDLGGRLDEAQADALAAAVELLGALHRRKDAVGIDTLLETLLEATGYEATLLSRSHGRRMLCNVRMVVELARSASAQHVALADFLAEVRQEVINEARYEQAAVAGEHDDVVRLMTIHKAKGLEFPIVVVPDLNAARRGHAGPLLLRSDWGATLNYTARPAGEDDETPAQPLSYRLAKRLEDDDGRKEDVRKLYVAATRHQDRLIFVGADWRSKDGELRNRNSYLAQMDGVLGITAALEAGRELLPYADGRHVAVVRRVVPGEARAAGGRGPAGRQLLDAAASGADLARRVGKLARGAGTLPWVGPLPIDSARVELAVTALNDFQACPMLYRWRHELRAGAELVPAAPGGGQHEAAPAGAGLDAATIGTLYHRCMELLDFARPQGAAALLRQAAGEMELDETADLAAIERDLADVLARFAGHELFGRLASAAATFRELDFVMDCPPVRLRGQIDLLFQRAGGAWHVVDYKSDRVDASSLAAHAAGYELQVLLYAAAAARHLGARPAEATLYFLRPALAHATAVGEATIDAVRSRVAQLAESLIRSRRSGEFALRRGRACAACPYRALCERIDPR